MAGPVSRPNRMGGTMTPDKLLDELKDDGAHNLDAEPSERLHAIALAAYEASRHLRAYHDYARAIAGARTFRSTGHLPQALQCEQHAERLYQTLPTWLRW